MPKVNIRHFAIEKFFARSGKKFLLHFLHRWFGFGRYYEGAPHEPPLCIYVVHVQYPAIFHNQIAVAGIMLC